MAYEKLEKEKQNKIISAACEMFAKYGYIKASMKDIAEAAGISKSVLFKYFSTKENLYIKLFRLASDSITEADSIARTAHPADSDIFSLMRRSAKARLSLFKEYPWIYRFSYTAFFDTDPFVKELVKKEYKNYRNHQKDITDKRPGNNSTSHSPDDCRGLRGDIPPEMAERMILWISQGFLEEYLNKDTIEPDELEQGFGKWIDILELLLRDKRDDNPGNRKKGEKNEGCF